MSTPGIFAPLRFPLYRNVWAASFVSNIGTLIQATAAAWAMTRLTTSETMVALVQTATAGPLMLLALVTGSIADLFDRRLVALSGLGLASAAALGLAVISLLGTITPELLLFFCFAVGCGTALFWPAWQSSVRDLVPAADMTAAVSLNGISYNVARSVGPAVGGAIVAGAGVAAGFVVNALSYVPMLAVLFLWRYRPAPQRVERESLGRSISLGLRYVVNSRPLVVILSRLAIITISGSSIMALLPLVARQLLGADAFSFGLLLGCFGLGAVVGGLLLGHLRARFSVEAVLRLNGCLMGLAVAAIAASRSGYVSGGLLVLLGAAWTTSLTLCNVSIQFAAPRWVAGRAMAMFQAAMSGGLAIGSLLFGRLAENFGLVNALLVSALLLIFSPLAGLRLRMPELSTSMIDGERLILDPDVAGIPDGRTGPVTIVVEYRVSAFDIGRFRVLMDQVRRMRTRNGASNWSLSRDVGQPDLWIERYSIPTWRDYLHFRTRATEAEQELVAELAVLHAGKDEPLVRRWLDDRAAGRAAEIMPAPDPLL